MKPTPISILISNYNSYEAIQLCIESIRKYTSYPYEIVVYDDNSYNKIDRKYLRQAKRDGWIHKLIEGRENLGHGGALNVLIDQCDTPLAMILDCDIEIKKPGWLSDMVRIMDKDIVLISGIIHPMSTPRMEKLPTWFESWFMMLNIEAYHDGLEVDWKNAYVHFQGKPTFCPVGGRLWLKLREQTQYRIEPIPEAMKEKFFHHYHVSVLSIVRECDDDRLKKARDVKFAILKKALKELREGQGDAEP